MLKRLLTLSMMLLFASSLVVAQSSAILKANGELVKVETTKGMKEALKASKFTNASGQEVSNVFMKTLAPNGLIDTLAYTDGGTFNTNFGFFDGNVMMQYFVAPADLVINAAGFSTSDDAGSENATVSLRLLKLNWTYDDLIGVPSPMNMGVYPSAGDGLGEIDAFGEDASGSWVDATDGAYPLPPWADNADPASNTYEYDLWSDGGFGWPVSAVASEFTAKVYQWVDMSGLFIPDTIKQGEVFAVALTHDGTNPEFADRVGFWSDNTLGVPGWKYYEEGRLAAGDGWWTRLYTWDFVVAVELTGDRAPVISGVTKLLTTYSTEAQTVEATITDDNPSGGPAGVASAELMVSLDSGKTYTSVAMTGSGDVYTADVPGQAAGTYITYYVKATDVEGGESSSVPSSYQIFEVVNNELLVVFNGGSESRAMQLTPYYLQGQAANYDLWAAYGPVGGDMLALYDMVVEIGSEGGPADDNQEAIRSYAATGGKSLAVIGQEVLGYLNGFTDSTFVAGDYEYDVLGVMSSYNDVNYLEAGYEDLPTQVIPIAGTTLADSLAMWLTANSLDTLWYYPTDILGADNWSDQFDPRSDLTNAETFLHSIAGDGSERPAGHNFMDGNSNNVMFMSVDPLSFEADSGWVGNSTWTPLAQWLGMYYTVGVRQNDNSVPSNFELSQNYPNPFNPTTNINFSIPNSGLTTLKVYNILGQEVATLLNKQMAAGSYTVDFDASNLSSGMYIYSIQSGDVEISKKMMLLK